VNTDLQARVNQFQWHHTMELGDGVVTPGGKSLAICQTEASLIFDRVNVGGRSVLDIGAWNGFFSFEAKRRGAARVLATDSFVWAHPGFRGRETFDIARAALGVDLEAREIDAANLSKETVGEFDIVLYLGVFYHRYDAVEALAKVAALAKDVLVLETHLDLRDLDVPAMIFYPGKELANDPTNWWGPNELCIIALLKGHGFTEIEVSAHPGGYNRAVFHAWRSTAARTKPLPPELMLRPVAEMRREEYRRRHPILAGLRGIGRALRGIRD
jgi:tRNA (mo5U34)-methyltransferase